MTARAEGEAESGGTRAASWAGIRSPVSWALLGLVIERPGYGYGLVKRFEREYAAMLPIKSDWHIYRALDGLKSRGLVDVEEGSEEDADDPVSPGVRQPKPRYCATDAGVKMYAEWLMTQVSAPRRQGQLFARQLGVLANRPRVALEIIDRCEANCLAAASESGATGRSGKGSSGHSDERLATRLTREELRLSLAAVLPWLAFARCEFRSLLASDPEAHEPA